MVRLKWMKREVAKSKQEHGGLSTSRSGGTPLFESNILFSGEETEAPGKRGASVRSYGTRIESQGYTCTYILHRQLHTIL